MLGLLCALSNQIIAQCAGRRADIYEFSPEERMELRNLMMDYLRSDIDDTRPGILRYTAVGIHSGFDDNDGVPPNPWTDWHNNAEEFLTWHRNYLQDMEKYILSRGFPQYVPLPAWHNITPIPDEFFNDAGADGEDSVLPEAIGIINQGPFGTGDTDFSDYIGTLDCNSWPGGIDNFAFDLEFFPHNFTHGGINGAMSSVINASGAAIFWLFHAFVDESYYCYQAQCENLESDIYVRDGELDEGEEPSNLQAGEELWTSPDIWVRNSNDGFENTNSEGLCFKESDANGIKPVYVYVRVWNRGDIPNPADEGDITLYWAHGSTALSWPSPWVTGEPLFCGQETGGEIGNQTMRSVNQDYFDEFDVNNNGQNEVIKDYAIYEFERNPPNPRDFDACLSDNWSHRHFCIHARINEPNDPITPSGDYYFDLQNDNNLAMMNITIFGEEEAEEEEWIGEKCDPIEWNIIGDPNDPDSVVLAGPDYPTECLVFGNYTTNTIMQNVELGIRFKCRRDWELLKNVKVEMFFYGYDWSRINSENGNITTRSGSWNWTRKSVTWDWTNESVLTAYPYIRGFTFYQQELARFCLQFSGTIPMPIPNPSTGTIDPIEFDIIQKVNDNIIGGERYALHVPSEGWSSSQVLSRSINTPNISLTKEIILYPNPAHESFTLVTPDIEKIYDVSITNSLGQVVSQIRNISGENTIFTLDFGKGLFVVTLKEQTSGEISTYKLIIE